ncbi:MAG: type II secretion system protein, partial [Synergistaceae bacterium]|nr:type II secretion system protein [Synergistaceae bacterium]
MTRSRKNRGFTLFELLIVIVVIGVLAAMLVIASSEAEST